MWIRKVIVIICRDTESLLIWMRFLTWEDLYDLFCEYYAKNADPSLLLNIKFATHTKMINKIHSSQDQSVKLRRRSWSPLEIAHFITIYSLQSSSVCGGQVVSENLSLTEWAMDGGNGVSMWRSSRLNSSPGALVLVTSSDWNCLDHLKLDHSVSERKYQLVLHVKFANEFHLRFATF